MKLLIKQLLYYKTWSSTKAIFEKVLYKNTTSNFRSRKISAIRTYLKRDTKTFFSYGKWLDRTAICAAARTRNIIGWRGPGDRKYARTIRLAHARGQTNALHENEFSVDPLIYRIYHGIANGLCEGSDMWNNHISWWCKQNKRYIVLRSKHNRYDSEVQPSK